MYQSTDNSGLDGFISLTVPTFVKEVEMSRINIIDPSISNPFGLFNIGAQFGRKKPKVRRLLNVWGRIALQQENLTFGHNKGRKNCMEYKDALEEEAKIIGKKLEEEQVFEWINLKKTE